MAVNLVSRQEGNITTHIPIQKIREHEIKIAKAKFARMQSKNIIRSDFEEDEWKISDQSKVCKINFKKEEFSLRKSCLKTGYPYEKLILEVKCFTVLLFHKIALRQVALISSYVLSELSKSYMGKNAENAARDVLHATNLRYYIEFLELTDFATENYIRQCKRQYAVVRENENKKRKAINPTTLAEFDSYFRFDSVIREFWKDNIDEQKKAYYYPLYIYWMITTILPMRVTELCLMDNDCITQKSSEYYLTIRRAPKENRNLMEYIIKHDYTDYTYQIPEKVATVILDYKKIRGSEPSKYNLLFSTRLMAESSPVKFSHHGQVFSSSNMNAILKRFYQDVIEKQYGLQIIDKNQFNGTHEHLMSNDCIMKIQLKDTRHLAMINLIMRGCNPMVIKEFAGHSSIAISSNYYSNTANFVRCATRHYYYKKKQEKVVDVQIEDENPLQFLIDDTVKGIQMDQGMCYSNNVRRESFQDCLKVNGNCHMCEFFLPNKKNKTVKEMETQINDEMIYVQNLLKSKQLEDRIEEFQSEVLKLQKNISGYIIAQYQNQQRKEIQHGTEKEF